MVTAINTHLKGSEMHSTNYYSTFIEVAEDCPVTVAEIPPEKSTKTAANLQFEIVKDHPYHYTSDEVLFKIFAVKKNIGDDQLATEKEFFFPKDSPVFGLLLSLSVMVGAYTAMPKER